MRPFKWQILRSLWEMKTGNNYSASIPFPRLFWLVCTKVIISVGYEPLIMYKESRLSFFCWEKGHLNWVHSWSKKGILDDICYEKMKLSLGHHHFSPESVIRKQTKLGMFLQKAISSIFWDWAKPNILSLSIEWLFFHQKGVTLNIFPLFRSYPCSLSSFCSWSYLNISNQFR